MHEKIQSECDHLRERINQTKKEVVDLHDHDDIDSSPDKDLSPGNVPQSCKDNMHANITLAFRHLEDVRMRLGKVMQAAHGGESILDK